jgi:TolB protein
VGGTLVVLRSGATTATVSATSAADPHWSYDGAWLSYTLKGTVHVVRADGTGDHPVPGAESPVAWSPNAATLAFTVGEGKALDVARADGPPMDLVKAGAGSVFSFAWSPDGASLAYSVRPGDLTAADQLFSVTADGGRFQRWAYAAPEASGIILAGWWPDGKGLLIWTDPSHSASVALDGVPLVSVPAAGSTVTLTVSQVYPPWVRWSPDGRSVLVVSGGGREPWSSKSLSVCTVESGVCTAVPQPKDTVSLDPAWAPDGRQIAFVRASMDNAPGTGGDSFAWYPSRHLWVASSDGGGAHEVPGGGPGVAAPDWSRDGRTLRYATGSSVVTIPVSGGTPTRLAGPLSDPVPGQDIVEWPLVGKHPWGGIAVWAP